MSNPSPMSKLPDAVLQGTAKPRVANQDVFSSAMLQREAPSSDVKAFCSLIARILVRCLRERDEQALHILGLSNKQQGSPDTTDLA